MQSTKDYKWVALYALGLGLLFWNAWLLGWLNHGSVGYLHLSISELNVKGQPNASLFTLLEYLSGLLLLIGGIYLVMALAKPRAALTLAIAAAIGLTGLLTVFDAAYPVNCVQYQHPACVAEAKSTNVDSSTRYHVIESRVTVVVTVILAVLIVAWAYWAKWPVGVLLAALILLGIIGSILIPDDNAHMVDAELAQRLWNVLVSLDIGLVALGLLAGPGKAFSGRNK